MTLTNRLKVLSGKRLGPKEIELAREGATIKSRHKEKVYGTSEGGVLFRRIATLERMTTPDISHGWERPHTGDYPTSITVEEYNVDGQLFRREYTEVSHGMVSKRKVIKHYRPGDFDWYSKTVEKSPFC